MIPDKIYFPADGLPRYIDWDGSPIRTKKVEDSDICYIRKDLLLEWLEAKVYEHNEDKFDDGFNTALGQVIDKINSL